MHTSSTRRAAPNAPVFTVADESGRFGNSVVQGRAPPSGEVKNLVMVLKPVPRA